ncbi:hypothetical protein NF699_04885 [Sphingomonadaceae bacterium OTU29LAMAA1]|nr:hypothetical protein NF699_04885 [Sphingomonadaceae bacterium OTU29LAMAA1]
MATISATCLQWMSVAGDAHAGRPGRLAPPSRAGAGLLRLTTVGRQALR